MSGGLLPSEFAEVYGRPLLRRFLQEHIDMQFQDLRAVMRLPQPQMLGTTGGGNFMGASALMTVICGASTLFYDAGPNAFRYPYDSQKRFIATMDYMPWDARAAGVQRGMGSKRLWHYARNPLAHAFGVSYHPGKESGQVPNSLQWTLEVAKREFALKEIYHLEESEQRPQFVNVPLRRLTTHPDEFVLDVGGLYWGVHRMLHALLGDNEQANVAQDMVRRLISGWKSP